MSTLPSSLPGLSGSMATLELHFSGRSLAKMDFLSKSDPIVQVYLSQTGKEPELIGQTEIIDDNHNPDWSTCVEVDFFFEEEQTILCKVLDADNDRVRLTDADFIGQTLFHLGKLVSSAGQTITQKLTRPNSSGPQGMLIISGEERNASNQLVNMEFSVPNLPNNHKWYNLLWHKPHPALVMWRSREDGKWIKVKETEVIQRSTNPRWKKLGIKAQHLCNGDLDRPLKIQIADYSEGAEGAEVIVEKETSVRELEQLDGRPLELAAPRVKKRKMNALLEASVYVEQRPSFLDHLKGGLELNLHVAIDFTASNGQPFDSRSLHFMDSMKPNQYQQVIQSVTGILSNYDSDQMYPVVGFGGKINNQVSHCFSLDPNGNEVCGVAGILQAYSAGLKNVALSGPTLFAPLLNQLNTKIAQSMQSYSYNIQLILTDGAIHDMENTIDCIVQSSQMPISIIIVGIGNADFSNMDALDADDGLLRARNGQLQVHDNVQFVPYNHMGGSASRLAREVLMELPDQVVRHFHSKGILPRAPRAAVAPPSLEHASTGLPSSAMFQRSATNAFVTTAYPSAPPAEVPETIPEAYVQGTAL